MSGSDDFTLFLWHPASEKKSLARMTGHQQLVNDVKFSPDGRLLASASFDKSIRLWDGKTGRFLSVLRGHVQAVYQLAWAADSRLLPGCGLNGSQSQVSIVLTNQRPVLTCRAARSAGVRCRRTCTRASNEGPHEGGPSPG